MYTYMYIYMHTHTYTYIHNKLGFDSRYPTPVRQWWFVIRVFSPRWSVLPD